MSNITERVWNGFTPSDTVKRDLWAVNDFTEIDTPRRETTVFQMLVAQKLRELVRQNYPGPYNMTEFGEIRSNLFSELVSLDKRANTTNEKRKVDFDREILVHWLAYLSGLVVMRETDFISSYLDENPSARAQSILNILNNPEPSTLMPSRKILPTVGLTVDAISRVKRDHWRTVGIWGGFDYGTTGHVEYLNKVRGTFGKFTKVFVFVSHDEEMKITRGPSRPYYPQDKRVVNLASMSAVDYVCPLPWPAGKMSIGYPDDFLSEIHRQLGLHFRVIGEKDDRFEAFAIECRVSDTILVYNEDRRLDSATDAIRATAA